MSHRRKEKRDKKKERKVDKQRPRIPSCDLWNGVYYQPVPEQNYTFTQRQQVSGPASERLLEGYNPESLSPTFQGGAFAETIRRFIKMGTKKV